MAIEDAAKSVLSKGKNILSNAKENAGELVEKSAGVLRDSESDDNRVQQMSRALIDGTMSAFGNGGAGTPLDDMERSLTHAAQGAANMSIAVATMGMQQSKALVSRTVSYGPAIFGLLGLGSLRYLARKNNDQVVTYNIRQYTSSGNIYEKAFDTIKTAGFDIVAENGALRVDRVKLDRNLMGMSGADVMNWRGVAIDYNTMQDASGQLGFMSASVAALDHYADSLKDSLNVLPEDKYKSFKENFDPNAIGTIEDYKKELAGVFEQWDKRTAAANIQALQDAENRAVISIRGPVMDMGYEKNVTIGDFVHLQDKLDVERASIVKDFGDRLQMSGAFSPEQITELTDGLDGKLKSAQSLFAKQCDPDQDGTGPLFEFANPAIDYSHEQFVEDVSPLLENLSDSWKKSLNESVGKAQVIENEHIAQIDPKNAAQEYLSSVEEKLKDALPVSEHPSLWKNGEFKNPVQSEVLLSEADGQKSCHVEFYLDGITNKDLKDKISKVLAEKEVDAHRFDRSLRMADGGCSGDLMKHIKHEFQQDMNKYNYENGVKVPYSLKFGTGPQGGEIRVKSLSKESAEALAFAGSRGLLAEKDKAFTSLLMPEKEFREACADRHLTVFSAKLPERVHPNWRMDDAESTPYDTNVAQFMRDQIGSDPSARRGQISFAIEGDTIFFTDNGKPFVNDAIELAQFGGRVAKAPRLIQNGVEGGHGL